jgi:hypothetical protein
MEFLQRLSVPRRLAARVWLFTLPSALVSFERRQRVPRMPIGRGRLLGLALIAGSAAAYLYSQRAEGQPAAASRGLSRLRERPAVAAGLLALSGLGVLLRSLTLTAYAFGLAFAFSRDVVELEEPQLSHRDVGGDVWEYDETQV